MQPNRLLALNPDPGMLFQICGDVLCAFQRNPDEEQAVLRVPVGGIRNAKGRQARPACGFETASEGRHALLVFGGAQDAAVGIAGADDGPASRGRSAVLSHAELDQKLVQFGVALVDA